MISFRAIAAAILLAGVAVAWLIGDVPNIMMCDLAPAMVVAFGLVAFYVARAVRRR